MQYVASQDIQVDRLWDVVIVGAGPAGAVAAHQLAGRGLSTLLVDRKSFPRAKVCGGCLNARAVAILHSAGLDRSVNTLSTSPIEHLELLTGRRRTTIALPRGIAIDRSEFDSMLVGLAIEQGAVFMPQTTATIQPTVRSGRRCVTLRSFDRRIDSVNAQMVLACDGLGANCLAQIPEMTQNLSRRSRIGIGAIADHDTALAENHISMAIGRQGYVGRVRLGDGRINIAAAVDPEFLRELGPEGSISRILAESGVDSSIPLAASRIGGTIPLTRITTRTATERVILLGDACGYVEPFTGDGMAVALEMALAAVPYVVAAQWNWQPHLTSEWEQKVRRIVTRRRTVCHGVSAICRRPSLVDLALAIIARTPRLAASLGARINRFPAELETSTR